MKVFIYSFLLVREKPTNKNAPNKAHNNIQNIMYIFKVRRKKPRRAFIIYFLKVQLILKFYLHVFQF